MIGKTRRCMALGIGFLALAGMAMAVSNASAGLVHYGGSVGNGLNGDPVQYGFVIAGTFNPSFDPYYYNDVYSGAPGSGIETTKYTQSVKDGAWIPIGSGTYTGVDGSFNGVGSTTKPGQLGQQIYLFCFDAVDPNQATHFALLTSTNSTWVLNSTSNVLDAKKADTFIYGGKSGSHSVDLQPIMAVPEPTTSLLLGTGLLALLLAWRARKLAA